MSPQILYMIHYLNINLITMDNKYVGAFPLIQSRDAVATYGLSKLEYFTAMAMQGLLISMARWPSGNADISLVKKAIEIAEETLKQLENA